jgi:hypothetical protein
VEGGLCRYFGLGVEALPGEGEDFVFACGEVVGGGHGEWSWGWMGVGRVLEELECMNDGSVVEVE